MLNFTHLMFSFSNEWMLKLMFLKLSVHFTMMDVVLTSHKFLLFCFVFLQYIVLQPGIR